MERSEMHLSYESHTPRHAPGREGTQLPATQPPWRIETVSDGEWDTWVEQHPYGDLLQSSAWATLKEPTWRRDRFAVRDGAGQLVAGAQLLLRALPGTGGKLLLAYASRGPILDWNNPALLQLTLEELERRAKAAGAIRLILDPPLYREDWAEHLLPILRKRGYLHAGWGTDMVEIQPRCNRMIPILPTAEAQLAAFSPKLRYTLKRAAKQPFVIHKLQPGELQTFFALLLETGKRDQIGVRTEAYYDKLLRLFDAEDRADFTLLSLQRQPALEQLTANRKSLEAELRANRKALSRATQAEKQEALRENTAALERALAKIEEEREELEGYPQDEIPLACAALLYSAAHCYYLYGGTSDRFRSTLPVYALLPDALERARKRGCTLFDFGGVSGELDPEKDPRHGGLELFKRKWGGDPIEYVGEFTLPLRPFWSRLWDAAVEIRKKLRGKRG